MQEPFRASFAAILTGDLVASRKRDTGAIDKTMDILAHVAADVPRDFGDAALPVVFDRYRGDGWQIFLPKGEMALRTALRLIAALKATPGQSIATRIGIGLGSANLPRSQDLGAASGDAFILAGDVLDRMERYRRLALPGNAGAAMQTVTSLLDWQSQNWTQAQAEALFEALRNQTPTQEEIAEKFRVSRQAIQIRLAKTGLFALREALWLYESTIRKTWEAEQ